MGLSDDELTALIARCAIRDEAALKRLLECVGPYLNGLALRIVRTEDVSNDVLQEAFLQIWQNAGSYRPHLSKPLTWLASIVRYRALDRYAQEKSRQAKFQHNLSDEELEAIPADACPLVELSANQTRRLLTDCLASLSAVIKQSVEMAYLQGYSRDEIAHALNTNASTVKSWLHRGAKRLKTCLQSHPATL